jgi:signal transduction histidine kinase
MQLGIRTGTESSLPVRLAWLTALRLLVLTMVLVVTTTIYLGGFTARAFSSKIALLTIAGAYGLAGIYAAFLRVGRALPAVAHTQLVIDQLTWTVIVYISGGATSGATSLYGLTCLSGAILLGVRGALLAASSAAAAYVVMCTGFVLGVIVPPPDQPIDAYATRWSEAAYPLFVNLLAMAVVTLLASYLAERLRTTGGHLVVARERAEQAERMAALGRLAAGLAHEIRNPLGSIAGSIELLRSGGALSAEDQKLCEIIQRETRRLNELVGDMLDLSRPRPPAKEQFDLAATAGDVVTLAGKSGRGTDVSLRYEGPVRAMVLADAAQMRQVVWNLVRNAIQASSPGDEVLVRVEPASGGGHHLEVCDRGPGIPLEAREQLFDAFFTTRSHGMGIGLAVVKRILDDHGFAIEVDSTGNGTTFRVIIAGDARSLDPAPALTEGEPAVIEGVRPEGA